MHQNKAAKQINCGCIRMEGYELEEGFEERISNDSRWDEFDIHHNNAK